MEKQILLSAPKKRSKKIWIFLFVMVLIWLSMYLFIVGQGEIRIFSIVKTKYCASMNEGLCRISFLCSMTADPLPCNDYGLCPEAFTMKCMPR